MSTDPVCVYCGAPLEDDVYKCDRCGHKNINFNRPDSTPRVEPYSTRLLGGGAEGFNLRKAGSTPLEQPRRQAPPPPDPQPQRQVQPQVQPQPQPVRRAPVAPPVERPRVSPPQPHGKTLFAASSGGGKAIIILTCAIAILFLIIASSKKMVAYGYFGAGNRGMGAGFQLMLFFFGPLSAYWAVNSFIPKGSGYKKLALAFWLLMQIVHFALFGINNPA